MEHNINISSSSNKDPRSFGCKSQPCLPIISTPVDSKSPIEQRPLAMNATAIDSRIFRNLFGTEEARHIFSDEQYVSRMIDVETALARAQAKAEVIPHDAAESMTESCDVAKIEYVSDRT